MRRGFLFVLCAGLTLVAVSVGYGYGEEPVTEEKSATQVTSVAPAPESEPEPDQKKPFQRTFAQSSLVEPKPTEAPDEIKTEPEEAKPVEPKKETPIVKNPIYNGYRLQEFRDRAIFEFFVGDTDVPQAEVLEDVSLRKLTIRFEKTLVSREKKDTQGSGEFLRQIYIKEDPEATGALKLKDPYYAMSQVLLYFTMPVTYEIDKEKGVLRIEVTISTTAEAEFAKKAEEKEMLKAQAEKYSTTAGVLGPVYAPTEDLNSNRLRREQNQMLDELEWRVSQHQEAMNFEEGIPDEIVYDFQRKEAPPYTLKYWKDHTAGSITSTNFYTTNYDIISTGEGSGRRDDAIVTEPAVAVFYRRPGTAQVTAGYNINKQFPTLCKTKTWDGVLQHNLRAGVTYTPQKPYSFAWQNTLNISNAYTDTEVLGGSQNGKDTMNYNYTTALGGTYRLTRRDTWSTGVGLSGNINTGGNTDQNVIGYATTGLSHAFSHRLSGSLNYAYSHIFDDKGDDSTVQLDASSTDVNNEIESGDSHSISAGLGYQLTRNLSTGLGYSVVLMNGRAFTGFYGNMSWHHRITRRLNMNASIASNFAQNTQGNYPLAARYSTSTGQDTIELLRYVTAALGFDYRISKNTNFSTNGTYAQARPVDTFGIMEKDSGGNKSDNFHFDAGLRRQLFEQKFAVDLRYQFDYYTYNGVYSFNTSNNTTETGNTNKTRNTKEHAIYLRLIYFFGAGGA